MVTKLNQPINFRPGNALRGPSILHAQNDPAQYIDRYSTLQTNSPILLVPHPAYILTQNSSFIQK